MFDLISTNLKLCLDARFSEEPMTVLPEFDRALLGKIILCPLCLQAFTREDFDSNDSTPRRLTREHILPSAGDRSNTTLTCKKCNNETGSALDSHLLKRIAHQESWERNGGPIRVHLGSGGGGQNGELYIKEDENGDSVFEVIGLPKQSNPKLQHKLIESLRDPLFDGKITLDYNSGYVSARADTALLRSAYLTMFRFFGYSYILHPTLDAVRIQIKQPFTGTGENERISVPYLLRGIGSSRKIVQLETTGVGWSSVKEKGEGWIVALKPSKQLPRESIVFMPKVGEDAAEFMKRLPCAGADDIVGKERVEFKTAYLVFSPDPLTNLSTCHWVRRPHSIGDFSE